MNIDWFDFLLGAVAGAVVFFMMTLQLLARMSALVASITDRAMTVMMAAAAKDKVWPIVKAGFEAGREDDNPS